MKLENSNVLVIGGAGFIGSFVVSELLKYPLKKVVVYDNFARGSKSYLSEQLKDDRCSLFPFGGDIREIDILNNAMEGMDFVISLAAMWLLHCKDYPRTAFDVNIAGTFNILEACVKNNIKKLIWSSSASVYGDAVELPMTEDHPLNNKNFYGASKIAGEAMATAFNDRYGLKVIGLRYMNVYGPNQDQTAAYTGVVPVMLNKIEANEAPLINGDGSQAYDFIYVEDVANAFELALNAEFESGVYNLGSGSSTSVIDFCKTLEVVMKNSHQLTTKLIHNTQNSNQEVNFFASIAKTKETFGWIAKTSLVDGLSRSLKK